MNKKRLLIPLLVVAVLLTACRGKTPDTPDQPDVSVTTSTNENGESGEGDSATSTTGNGDKTTQKTDKTTAANNVVDWNDVFGDDDPTTTTTTGKGGKTTTGKGGKTTTSATKKPTNTTTTTTAPTVPPTTIDKITVPAVGTDVDGKGRIKVSQVDIKDGVLTITIRNYTDEQKQQWITQETDYVTYACYDKKGNPLQGDDDNFGYLYLGCLEDGKDITFTVVLPKGTDSVRLTGAKVVYWTPWS